MQRFRRKANSLPVGGQTGEQKGGEQLELYCVDRTALKKAMIDAGLDTILKLSEASGVNRNTLGEILTGTAYPSSIVMQKIVNALHLTPEQAGQIFFTLKLA